MAVRGHPRHVAFVAVVGTLLAAVSPLWNETQTAGYFLPLITVVAGSAIAVWGARERHAGDDARAAAEAERRQLLLLAEAARITDGAADIDEALRRLALIAEGRHREWTAQQ